MKPLALGILSGLGAAAGAFVTQLAPNGTMVWPPSGQPNEIAVELLIVASVVASIVYSVTWEHQRKRAKSAAMSTGR